jgi:nicotinamidase-related amidase
MSPNSNILCAEHSVLIGIDIQTKLADAMPPSEAKLMLTNTIALFEASTLMAVPVFVTEQYPKGLGFTDASLVNKLPVNTQRFEKTGFSCCLAEGFSEALSATGRIQLILVGLETHVCILQSALALHSLGYQVYVVEDAVCSRKIDHKFYALQRMQQQGITLINYESVLFEWLKDASHPNFKTVSGLLR